MFKLIAILLLIPSIAFAGQSNPGVISSGAITANHAATFVNPWTIQDGGALGTAAAQNTGTSGANLGLLNGNLTFGGNDIFSNTITGSITGNAATVTTNANLTGDVTSSGNATTLATVNSNVGTFQGLTVNGKGLVTAASNQNYLTANQGITWAGSGDITGSASGTTAISPALTLATVNSNVGTFQGITVNGKGLVTAATNQNYLTGNQTITLSGDASGSGTTAITVNVAQLHANTLTNGDWCVTNGTIINCTVTPITNTNQLTNGAGFITGNQTITLSGDLSGSGATSIAGTLATVNTNTGSFGSSTAIPNFTVNGKGLITAAGTNAVVAPAGTLTGATLASGVTASSLQTFGTLTAPLNIGTPAITDSGVLLQATSSVAGFNQFIIQNTNSGSTASTNVVVNNNLGTATTYYGEFGMNSSGFTGSGAFNGANTVYLDSQSGDLALGTLTNNPVHIVINNGSADTVTIGTTTAAAMNVVGTVTATTFSGSGASLTSIGTANMGRFSGTPSNTTYARGDGTWATPSGGGSVSITAADSSIVVSPSPITGTGTIVAGNFTKAMNASSGMASLGGL